jgi:hypothetical protein
VLGFLQQGFSEDQVSFMLQDTTAYKQRFSGNEIRRKQGLPVLSPADYLNTEASYRQIMQTAGLPKNFYDAPDDFANWIGNDVAPTEINDRVNAAVDATNKLSPETQDVFRQWYGVQPTDLAAYFLDQSRAMPALQNIARAVKIGGAGGDITQQRAEQLAGQSTLTNDQLAGNESNAVQMGKEGGLLGAINGIQYDQSTAENELFLNDAAAAQKRKQLTNAEQANFQGAQTQSGKTQLARPAAAY